MTTSKSNAPSMKWRLLLECAPTLMHQIPYGAAMQMTSSIGYSRNLMANASRICEKKEKIFKVEKVGLPLAFFG